jgi:hypothetical protein
MDRLRRLRLITAVESVTKLAHVRGLSTREAKLTFAV